MSPERRARDPGVHTAQPRPGRSVGCCVTILRLDSSALREWERIVAGPVTAGAPTRRRAAWPLRFARLAAQGLLVTLLPFLVLVKVAVFLYTREGCATMLALAGGTACTAAVVTAYAALVWHRVTGRVRLALVARRLALPLVVAYCGYALIYLSSANAKSDRVRAYYASLHPLLRVALSTLILADRELVITDLARGPNDYATMGLARTAGRCITCNATATPTPRTFGPPAGVSSRTGWCRRTSGAWASRRCGTSAPATTCTSSSSCGEGADVSEDVGF